MRPLSLEVVSRLARIFVEGEHADPILDVQVYHTVSNALPRD